MAESKASIKDWVKGEGLGSGTFAVVTSLTHRLSGEQIAIKTFKDDRSEICQKEIDLLKKCAHKNVVKLVPIPEEFKLISHKIICMECCREGNLRKLLNQPQNCAGLPEPIIRRCLANIGSALEYIHRQNVIHRDLKPENIVMQKVDDQVSSHQTGAVASTRPEMGL
ncbi:unnamed protein product [Nesidiocoris tenuis]|uniref:IkappaB kinase n=1 Tax=Nesidiocoris tenuis TaxID=355587 RepID=A0A6H5GMA7_9HEMI|nr:unnamed protein product [Nesidiocoris tenuis]